MYTQESQYPTTRKAARMTCMYRLRIKEVAISKGYNQSSLSRATDISFTTIKKIWRNPFYEINIVTLHKIARTLGVPTSELIEDVEEG